MHTQIHTHGFESTEAIQQRVYRQLVRNLRRHEDEIVTVEAFLSGSSPSGEGMKAVMRASLRGLPPVTVTSEHENLYVAINRAAKRLQRAVRRSITKGRRVEPRRLLGLRRQALVGY